MNEDFKIPKQMRHWLEKNGIYCRDYRRLKKYDLIIASTSKPEFKKGEDNRMFRVVGGTIEICDGDFDRWANSVGYKLPCPTTEAEFNAVLKQLIKETK